jgi:hypothetical protein
LSLTTDVTLALDPIFFDLLAGSYFRFVGERLVPSEHDHQNAARWLYEEAPYCVLAHSTDPDPIFIYGNKTAQTCFEYSWDELTSLPSRLSAEEHSREERQRLLDSVKRHGFASGYRGLRIAKSGRRFWIENVTVWQLVDRGGVLRGQAAVYRQWREAAQIGRNSAR